MKIENSIKGLITILFIALCSSRPGLAVDAPVPGRINPVFNPNN